MSANYTFNLPGGVIDMKLLEEDYPDGVRIFKNKINALYATHGKNFLTWLEKKDHKTLRELLDIVKYQKANKMKTTTNKQAIDCLMKFASTKRPINTVNKYYDAEYNKAKAQFKKMSPKAKSDQVKAGMTALGYKQDKYFDPEYNLAKAQFKNMSSKAKSDQVKAGMTALGYKQDKYFDAEYNKAKAQFKKMSPKAKLRQEAAGMRALGFVPA